MTKKRIADLLKEEIEKSAEGTGGDNPADSNQTPTAKARKPAAAKSAATKSTATKSTAAKATAAKATAAKPDEALTQKIAALETALQKNAEQVAALRADVDTHQSRVFELKDALQDAEAASQKKDAQLEDLTAKLAEAKQTILKLTEASESAAEQTSQQTSDPAPEPAAEKESEAAKRQSLQLKQRSPYSSYKSIPEYAIQRGTPASGQNNSMMNDDDLGWVD